MKNRGKTKKKAGKKLVKTSRKALKPKEKVKVTVVSKVLGKAPEKYSFFLNDGRKLRTVYELIDELETMNDDIFREHVNEFKNDFANWLNDVFEAKDLSEEIRRTQHRIDTQRSIMKHIIRELKKVAKK